MVDLSRMVSPTEYAKEIGKTKNRVGQMVREGKLECVSWKGGYAVLRP